MLDAKLVIIGGPDVAQEYFLALPATIGRGSENAIPLAHPLVSRRHCEIFESNGRLFVRDLGSLNGTFVGNQPAEGETPIEPGQLLTVGTVTFRAIYNGYDIDGLDESYDGDGADVLADAGFGEETTYEDRAGLTMEHGAAAAVVKGSVAKTAVDRTAVDKRLDGATTDTNPGLDTDTTAPSLADTERVPPNKRASRPRRSR